MLQMIYTDKGLIRGKQLHEVYPFFEEKCAEAIQTKQPVYNAVQNVDNTTFTIDYVPVIVGDKAAGVVITCQTVKKIQQIESQIRKKLSEKGLVAAYTFSDMIRKSDLMESTVTIARKFAAVSSNVLIVGETGTGKELMAQSIHNASERSNGPLSPSTARHFRKIFWKVNCLVMQTVHLPEAGAVGKWDFLSRLIGELCFWMKYQKSPSIFRGNFFGHFRNVRYAESVMTKSLM